LRCSIGSSTIVLSDGVGVRSSAPGRHLQKTKSRKLRMRIGILHAAATTALTLALSVSAANAQKKYDPGASDTEIKIGQTVPFSGPASA
jgi:hypothetical protein